NEEMGSVIFNQNQNISSQDIIQISIRKKVDDLSEYPKLDEGISNINENKNECLIALPYSNVHEMLYDQNKDLYGDE
ncbi:4481_t:CDS:2, partial [Diversispora eburnea]